MKYKLIALGVIFIILGLIFNSLNSYSEEYPNLLASESFVNNSTSIIKNELSLDELKSEDLDILYKRLLYECDVLTKYNITNPNCKYLRSIKWEKN